MTWPYLMKNVFKTHKCRILHLIQHLVYCHIEQDSKHLYTQWVGIKKNTIFFSFCLLFLNCLHMLHYLKSSYSDSNTYVCSAHISMSVCKSPLCILYIPCDAIIVMYRRIVVGVQMSDRMVMFTTVVLFILCEELNGGM